MAIQRMRLPSLAPVRQEMSGEIDGEWSYVERPWWDRHAKIERRTTLDRWELRYEVRDRFGQGQRRGWPFRLCLYYRGEYASPLYATQVAAVFLDDEARIKRSLTLWEYHMPAYLARIGPRKLVAWAVDDARSVWSR